MKVIKRDGHIVDYSPDKIEEAVSKANLEVSEEDRVSDIQIRNIIKYIGSLIISILNCLIVLHCLHLLL